MQNHKNQNSHRSRSPQTAQTAAFDASAFAARSALAPGSARASHAEKFAIPEILRYCTVKFPIAAISKLRQFLKSVFFQNAELRNCIIAAITRNRSRPSTRISTLACPQRSVLSAQVPQRSCAALCRPPGEPPRYCRRNCSTSQSAISAISPAGPSSAHSRPSTRISA